METLLEDVQKLESELGFIVTNFNKKYPKAIIQIAINELGFVEVVQCNIIVK